MPVRKAIADSEGVYFLTFSCARWLPLFTLTSGYNIVYQWFDYLKAQGHSIVGYVIMPHHVHAVIAFSNTGKPLNTIVGNGKRFAAYEIVKRLTDKEQVQMLEPMKEWVNATDRKRNKQHEVFEPSFDWKACRTDAFIQQKLDYMHWNPCKGNKLAEKPENYAHSSAQFYITNKQGIFGVMSFMELQDVDLTKKL